MILSSADILRILQGSAVIRAASSEIRVVEKKPLASGREGFFVYIEKYPTADEFEATWRVWIESDGSEPDDVLFAEMRQLLPNFEFKLGLIIEATVRDFKTDKTEARPKAEQAPAVMPPAGWMSGIEKRFEALVEDIQDRMLLVNSGRPGKDGERGPEGRPGAPGRDGRDGKDVVATDAHLDDLKDVEISSAIPLERGQVLTWDGVRWTNLFTRQTSVISGGGGGGGGDASVETPVIGTTITWKYHVEQGSEPTRKDFHTDNVDPELITILHVSDYNYAGNDVTVLLDELLRTATKVYVSKIEDPSEAHMFQINGYVESSQGYAIDVTHLETPGSEPYFDANKVYSFLFIGSDGNFVASIDDLTDVDTTTVAPQPGQTLVWDGNEWVPGNFAAQPGIADAPADGNYYVRHNGTWVSLAEAFNAISLMSDGGDFTTGDAQTLNGYILDGGDLTEGKSWTGFHVDPDGYEEVDGGYWS